MLKETDKLFLAGLKGCGLNAEQAAMVCAMLETDEQRERLVKFMQTGKKAQPMEIVEKAVEIARA